MNTHVSAPMSPRRDRLLHERIHDPYHSRGKTRGTTYCGQCGVVHHEGRWQWADTRPLDAREETCPACKRVRDAYPAGVLTLTGLIVTTSRNELVSLARHQEKAETAEHPLHRIMAIEEHPASLVIKTTDIHLPWRIADALRHAFKGSLDAHYDEEGYYFRGHWHRDQ